MIEIRVGYDYSRGYPPACAADGLGHGLLACETSSFRIAWRPPTRN